MCLSTRVIEIRFYCKDLHFLSVAGLNLFVILDWIIFVVSIHCRSFSDDISCSLFHSRNSELNSSVFLELFLCKMVTREGSFGGVIAMKHEVDCQQPKSPMSDDAIISPACIWSFFNHQVQRRHVFCTVTCHHLVQQKQNATLVLLLTEISFDNTFIIPSEALPN